MFRMRQEQTQVFSTKALNEFVNRVRVLVKSAFLDQTSEGAESDQTSRIRTDIDKAAEVEDPGGGQTRSDVSQFFGRVPSCAYERYWSPSGRIRDE